MREEFHYEIVEHIATLSESGTTSKELNLVSYNGGTAKYDIRIWQRRGDEEKLLKGVTLTQEEARLLKEALNAREDI